MKTDVKGTRDRARDALNRTSDPEILARTAEVLGVEVAYLPEDRRPNFGPDQVRCTCQLKVGLTYGHVHGNEGHPFTQLFTVLEKPFFSSTMGSGPGWWVKVRYDYQTRHNPGSTISLEDANLHPYSLGTWNPSNYLAFTDGSRHLACRCRCCAHHCHCPDSHSHGHHNCNCC